MSRIPWLPSGPLFRDERGRLDPRFWLLLALIAVFASFIPYAFWLGPAGFLVNAALTVVAVVGLTKNVRGERRLAREPRAAQKAVVAFSFSFPSRELADEAADTLTTDGYSVETRSGADDGDWLVLATASLPEGDLGAADEQMALFAESVGGEYGGYGRSPTTR